VPADPSVGSLSALCDWMLARLPEGPSHVIAQSMGGVIATRLAAEHPDGLPREDARGGVLRASGEVVRQFSRAGDTAWR
jgi:pimeloyl-ACP methyl ester carboxylesterase